MKTLQNILKHILFVLPILLITSCGLGKSPEQIIKEATIEVNKSCPSRVDEMTVMREVIYENHRFIYVYELDNVPDSEIIMDIDEETLAEYLSNDIKENARNDSDVKYFLETLRKDNAKLIHRYVLTDGSGRTREIEVDY